ncbi:MAG TPA: DUF6364 family protein [Longimicrobium sp.]|jgi:hypothetical protein
MPRITRKLALDSDAVRRGERFCELHGTTLSSVISDFLLRLPLDGEEADLTPTVRRLRGIASDGVEEADYHRHLTEKYGF